MRASTVQALATITPREQKAAVVGALLDRLKDEDSDVRASAVQALATITPREQKAAVVGALLDRLKDEDSDVRASAVRALATITPDQQEAAVVSALLDQLKDDDASIVRVAAAKALATVTPSQQSAAVVGALLGSLKDDDAGVRAAAATALAKIVPSKQKALVVRALLDQLKADDNGRVLAATVQAVVAITPSGQKAAVVGVLRDRLNDPDRIVRIKSAQILGTLNPTTSINDARSIVAVETLSTNSSQPEAYDAASLLLSLPQSLKAQAVALELMNFSELIKVLAESSPFAEHERALVVITSGGTPIELVQGWLGHPKQTPSVPTTTKEARQILRAMNLLWPVSEHMHLLREEMARRSVEIIHSVCARHISDKAARWLRWIPEEWRGVTAVVSGGGPARCQQPSFLNTIQNLQKHLSGHYREADDIKNIIAADARTNLALTWLVRTGLAIFGYVVLWSAVMLSFPRSRFVQSALFFSPRLRKLSSVYISEVFPFLPFARRRLLSPFRKELGPKEDLLDVVPDESWFPDVEVTVAPAEKRIKITQALPAIKGLTVLEGASGLGKTVYLMRLARNPKRLVAFVQAAEENGDVLKAIAARLPSDIMKDANFLNNLIYAGGIDICIDGLNEVSADARANVVAFARRMSKANVLLATQPFRWDVPQGRRLLRLQPLRPEQLREFLVSRGPLLANNLPVRGQTYIDHVDAYLERLHIKAPADKTELDARDRALSNPMDLTTIAMIIGRGLEPDLLNLQDMAYQQAATDYATANGDRSFPIRSFTEYVYDRCLRPSKSDEGLLVLDDQRFARECEVLAEHRLLLTIEASFNKHKDKKSWIFRHDKVRDFFLYQAIVPENLDKSGTDERTLKHIDDPRFRGVFLLASLRAPLDYAKWLRERIADRAAETRDPALLYQYWENVRKRVESQSQALV